MVKFYLFTFLLLWHQPGLLTQRFPNKSSPDFLRVIGNQGGSGGGWTSKQDESTSSSSTRSSSPSKDQLEIWEANNTQNGGADRATNLNGIPLPSLTASQTVGSRGQILLQDFVLQEKLSTFNRERIPERSVHAKGGGAHGTFTVTHDISQYTKAKFLNGIGKETPVFVRFSTTGGELGSSDTIVDPHGFAIKLYTEEGNHDFVGNDIEVFMIRDPMLFPDMSRSRKRNPQTHLKDQNMWWDFVSLRPESTLHTMHLFSDIAKQRGYRRMGGSAVHTYRLVNAKGDYVFAKFKWKSQQTAPAMTFQEAKALLGTSPDYFNQDLYDAIATKNYPKWTFYIQVMSAKFAKKYHIDPFDPTRQWREEEFPLIPVGEMVLNRNPVNYFADVEQSGFLPSNMVPGIEASPDKILAGRILAYADALRYRLGTNYAQLPINRPLSEVSSYTRDGAACLGINGNGSPNYYPNSFGGSEPDPEASHDEFSVSGTVDRYDLQDDEHFQARLFLQRDIDPAQRQRMVESIADRLKDAIPRIRERVYERIFDPISKEFGDEIRAAVETAQANAAAAAATP